MSLSEEKRIFVRGRNKNNDASYAVPLSVQTLARLGFNDDPKGESLFLTPTNEMSMLLTSEPVDYQQRFEHQVENVAKCWFHYSKEDDVDPMYWNLALACLKMAVSAVWLDGYRDADSDFSNRRRQRMILRILLSSGETSLERLFVEFRKYDYEKWNDLLERNYDSKSDDKLTQMLMDVYQANSLSVQVMFSKKRMLGLWMEKLFEFNDYVSWYLDIRSKVE